MSQFNLIGYSNSGANVFDNLTAVPTAGNDSDLSIVLKDDLATPTTTTTISSSSVSINTTTTDASGSYSGNAISLQTDATGSSVGIATLSESAVNTSGTLISSITGGISGIPNPPYPAPDAQWGLSVNSGTYIPSLTLSNGAPFENATNLTLNLNNLTHNQGTGEVSPDDNFTISTNKNLILTANNVDLSSNGRLIVPSLASTSYLDYNNSTGRMSLVNSNAGGALKPQFSLTNTNATGSVSFEIYKNKPSAGIAGDPLFNQSVFGKDSANSKQEYTRITHTIRDNSGGGEDGSIEMGCFIAGTYAIMLQLNGVQNEVNLKRNLDVETNSIVSTNGNIELNATSSSSTGDINITAKTDVDITATAGNVNITAPTNVFIEATGDNLSLTAGNTTSLTTPILELNSADLRLAGTTTTTTSASFTSSLGTTDDIGDINTYLKVKLDGNYIWLPYFNQDPNL
jgi:hypothetical protein